MNKEVIGLILFIFEGVLITAFIISCIFVICNTKEHNKKLINPIAYLVRDDLLNDRGLISRRFMIIFFMLALLLPFILASLLGN